MNIAIFGAGGPIGTVTANELLRRGHRVRLVGRSPEKLRALAAGAEPFPADLDDAAQARSAAAGMDAILVAVGLPYPEFARYPALTRTILEAARAEGVRELLLIGTVYPYGRPRTARVAEDHAREPHTRKGRARKEQADIVLAAHDPDGMRTAVLVLPDFYGPNVAQSYAAGAFTTAMSGKTGNLIGPIDTPHQFVFVPDVAPIVAELFARPDLFGTTYHFGGAEPITTRALVAEVERQSGTHAKTLVATKPLLRLLGLVNPLMREIVEMTYLWTEPVILDDAKLERAIGPLHRTSYRDGVAATLAAARLPVSA